MEDVVDWYQILDVLLRCILFAHFLYSLILWLTSNSSQSKSNPAANIQDVLTALDRLFVELLNEIGDSERSSTDEDYRGLKRLLIALRC